jgi:LPS-assembly protein
VAGVTGLRALLIAVLLLAGMAPAWAQTAFSLDAPATSVPVHFKADTLDARRIKAGQGGRLEAQGNVTVEWAGRTLEAERVAYDPDTGILDAQGDVRVHDDFGNELTCETASIRIDDLSGQITEGELHLTEPGYHLTGEKFERTGPESLSAEGATFSACDGSFLSWRVDADWINVEKEGYLTGGGGVFRMGDIPLLWLPWFAYPAKFERQTGFLTPDFGYSSSEGYKTSIPFFWAFSESADLLLHADYRSREGWAQGAELRYVLAEDHEGRLGLEHYNRRSTGHSFDVLADHQSFFSNGAQADLYLDYIGEKERQRDFGETLDDRGISRIENHLVVSRGFTPGTVYGLGRYTQAFSQAQSEVLQTLPSVGLVGAEEPLWGPLYGRLDGEATRFWRSDDELDRATRFRVDPALAMDLGGLGAGFSVRSGYRQHYYVEDQEETGHGAAWAEATGRLSLFRRFDTLAHLIEPRVGFRWDEAGRGGDVVEFDDEDIFIHQAELDFSIETRLLETASGRSLVELDVGRALDMGAVRNGGYQASDWNPWRGELAIEPWKGIGLRADGDLDPDVSDPWLRWATEAYAEDARGDKLFYRQQYIKGDASYIDAGIAIVLSRLFRVRYRNRHSIRDDQNLEQEAGFAITHNCWELTTRVARVYREEEDDYDNRIFFAFTLKGMGRSREDSW